MGQRRTRKFNAPQEVMDVAEEIIPEPSSGSQLVAPITDSKELENTQAQGVPQGPLSTPDQPIDRND